MLNIEKLSSFLVEAKKATYASGESASKIIEKDGSTSLFFEKDGWRYHDNYFGGEPFGGREVVFLDNNPVYMMVYYGAVNKSVSAVGDIYKILQEALSRIPLERPFRGPNEYENNGLVYKNTYSGDIELFSGEEIIISADGKELYKARYTGGFICQRN